MSQQFKIFYSWQSDLPNNKSRNVIQSAIEKAVRLLKDTIEIEADRDTKGVTGSPNIESVIFQKIDESDLFIADLSVVTSYEGKNVPNPNVLVELGYAVGKLGWERIICFANTEFGDLEHLPFDINHHRLTGFYFDTEVEGQKSDTIKKLRDIIISNVRDLMEKGPFSKPGFAMHAVGTFDFTVSSVKAELIPYDIQNNISVKKFREKLLNDAREAYEKAVAIKVAPVKSKEKPKINESMQGMIYTSSTLRNVFLKNKVKVELPEKENIKNELKEYLNIDVDDSFFELGGLEVQKNIINGVSSQYYGSDEAKAKYKAIKTLAYPLVKYEFFDKFIHTFDGMEYYVLAIKNKSEMTDTEVNISVKVDKTTADVFIPDRSLICDELNEDSAAGIVYKQKFIPVLFELPKNAKIYDASGPYPEQPDFKAVYQTIPFMEEPKYDFSDYEREIQKYVATPTIDQNYDFNVMKLQAQDQAWIGKGILLRRKADKVRMVYTITSDYTGGRIRGVELLSK